MHHAIALLDTTTTVRPGSPFYLQGEYMATGGALKQLQGVEYELCATLANASGSGAATIKIYNSAWLGLVSVSTVTVTLLEGRDFTGLTGTVYIAGAVYTISSVDSATQITLTGSAGSPATAMMSDSAPVGTIALATPGTQTLVDNFKSVGKCYKRYLGLDLTAISGTGASVQAYCRVF